MKTLKRQILLSSKYTIIEPAHSIGESLSEGIQNETTYRTLLGRGVSRIDRLMAEFMFKLHFRNVNPLLRWHSIQDQRFANILRFVTLVRASQILHSPPSL